MPVIYCTLKLFLLIVIYHPSSTVICYHMKTLSAFGSKVFLFCGVKNILARKACGISRKDKLTHLFFFWGWYLGGCPTPCCPYAGVQKMEQVCTHVVLVRSYITLSPGFYFLSGLSFLPSFFSQLFSCFFPLFFLSFPTHSLSLSCCKFYSPSLSSFPPLPPSFLPSFLPPTFPLSFSHLPSFYFFLPPCLHICSLHP